MRASLLIGLMGCSLAQLGSAEKAGRIDTEIRGVRCSKKPISHERCKMMRDRARDRSCINDEEFDLLVRNELCPICDWDFERLDAYVGYCPE